MDIYMGTSLDLLWHSETESKHCLVKLIQKCQRGETVTQRGLGITWSWNDLPTTQFNHPSRSMSSEISSDVHMSGASQG